MAVPKRRTSRSRRDMRRANHQRISVPGLSVCPACGENMRPHRACPSCGQYKGREVIAVADESLQG